MTYPTKLPMQVRSEVIEFERRPRTRAADDAAEADAGDEIFDVVLSSEAPCERWFGIEVLSHEKSAIDMTFAKNGLPLLLEHGRSLNQGMAKVDPDSQIGIIENIRVENGKLRGEARFSRSARAQQIRQDVEDGIRPWISVGYVPVRAKQTKVAEKANEKSEYLVTRWQPVEGSLVSLPADPNAGVGRSAPDGVEYAVEVESDVEVRTHESEEPEMAKPEGTQPTTTTAASPTLAAIETRSNGAGSEAVTALADRNTEIGQIIDVCEANGLGTRAREWLAAGHSYDQVCRSILEVRKAEPRRIPGAEEIQAIPKKDRKKYNYGRAIRSLLSGEKLDGVEAEVHSELVRARPDGVQIQGGVFLPMDLRDQSEIEQRSMASNLANKGADLVFDSQGELIEILRATAVLPRLGARVLTGLSGPITFPRQNGDVTVFWVGENPGSDPTSTDADIDTVLMQPKTLIGTVDYSRQLLYQTSGLVDSMLRESLGVGTGLAFDRGGLHGTGAAGQVTGIYNHADVQSTAMGSVTPTWVKITDMIGQVADQNAALGSLGFVTTALLAARLMATLQASAAGAAFIWQGTVDDGRIGGYRAIGSTQASKVLGAGADEHAFAFGNFRDQLLGMWGAGVEVIADEVTLARKGMIRLTSFQMGDNIVRHGPSFSKATAAKPA